MSHPAVDEATVIAIPN